MIDYLSIATMNIETINKVYSLITKTFQRVPTEKGWNNTEKFYKRGITLYFTKNKQKEYIKLIIKYSPHKQYNNNKHNANEFSMKNAQKWIIRTNSSLGITENDFINFYISQIEIGINFKTSSNPDNVLKKLCMYSKFFFKQSPKYSHYYTAPPESKNRNKYYKIKYYWKSMQKIESINKTNYEMGYCPENVLRFEIKIERLNKFKDIKLHKLNDLFANNLNANLKNYILKLHDEVFYFNPKEVITSKLTTTQKKKNKQQQKKKKKKIINERKRNKKKKKYKKKKLPPMASFKLLENYRCKEKKSRKKKLQTITKKRMFAQ